MNNFSWQKIILTIAALSIVAGASFLLSASGRQDPVLDRPPQVIREIEPNDFPGQGSTEEDQPGGVFVMPSELLVDNAAVGVELPAIKVTNRSQLDRKVELDFVPVTRATGNGVPVIDTSAPSLAAGRQLVEVKPSSAVLKPGQSLAVKARIIGKPEAQTLVGAVGISIRDNTEVKAPEKRGVSVGVVSIYRLNAMIYATFPGSRDDSVDLNYLRAEQDGENIRFLAGVQSTGQVIATPSGTVTITDANGQRVAGGALAGDQRVIPGQVQELVLAAPVENLPPGEYQAEVKVINGADGQSLSRNLVIAADGKISDIAADLALTSQRVDSAPGEPFPVEVQTLNSGNQAFNATATVELFASGQEEPLQTEKISLSGLNPEEIRTENLNILAPEKEGSYGIVGSLRDDQGQLLMEKTISLTVTSRPQADQPFSIKLRDWLSDNPLRSLALGIICFGLLVLLLLSLMAITKRARSSRRKDHSNE